MPVPDGSTLHFVVVHRSIEKPIRHMVQTRVFAGSQLDERIKAVLITEMDSLADRGWELVSISHTKI